MLFVVSVRAWEFGPETTVRFSAGPFRRQPADSPHKPRLDIVV